jgi:hypothetical protein
MFTPAGNNAFGASGTGRTSRYRLILLYFIEFIVNFLLILNTFTCLVIKLLINCIYDFEIKIYPKMPIYLTIRIYIYRRERKLKIWN